MISRPFLVVLTACLGFASLPRSAVAVQDTGSSRRALAGIAVDERLDREPVLAAVLPPSATDLRLIVRIGIDAAGIRPDGLTRTLADLDRRLGIYTAKHITIVISLGAFPQTDGDVDSWRATIRAIAEHGRGQVAGYQVGATGGDTPPPADRYAFLLRLASVQLRAADAAALVIQGSVSASFDQWQAMLYATGIAPYVDGIALAGAAGDDEAFRARVDRMRLVVDGQDASSVLLLGPMPLPSGVDLASASFLDSQFRALGTRLRVTSYSGNAASLRAALAVAQHAADLFGGDIETIDERAASLRVSRGGVDVIGRMPHRLVFSTGRVATYLVYTGPADGMPIDVDVSVPGATTPVVRDLLTGKAETPSRVQKGEDGRVSVTVPAAAHALVLDFNAGATERYIERSEVRTGVWPSVDEIIARHQQAQAGQDAVLDHYTAHLRMEQHFHPSPADPAYNIVTENRLFFERGRVEWEEQSFSLNGATWTANRPSFPLVQPEKVLSLPLDLRLSRDYTYRLGGVENVQGRPAYVVHFEPVASGRALYRGTVWIDRELFVRLKVQAVESRTKGMVVSNDETHTYHRVGELEGRPIWLLDRLSSQQMFLIAGRTVLVERESTLTDIVLNPAEFQAARQAVEAGGRIMYRDTDQGVRYLVKKGEARVVSEQLTTATKAFALGVQVDPSFDAPLPIGGLDVLDFDFLGQDMQFALLFAGVFAAGNVQKANLWGGRFDVNADFFYLAVKSNDGIFDAQGEQTTLRVRHIPVSTGFNIGFQASAFQKLIGRYELRYDDYSRDEKTAPDFILPASTATEGLGLGYEYRQRGYSLLANVMEFRRTTADPWGPADDRQTMTRTYTKYDVGLSKDFIFATFHTVHLNGAYFGGDQLDRFSMYQFGLFDPARMHGVPSAVRFAEIAMFRGSYSFNLFDQYRVDLFVDHARGQDPQRSGTWVPVTGLGLGLNLRSPRDTILRVDLGRSFLPDTYRGAGSTVLQVMLLKPL